MLKFLTYFLLFFLFLGGAFASPRLSLSSEAFGEEVPFKINFSNVDLELGKTLEALFNELGKNQLKPATINQINSYQGKIHSYAILNPVIERLKKIITINDQETFYQHCSIINNDPNSFTDSILERFNISVDKYCRHLFLKRMLNFESSINLSSRDLSFFKDASAFFANNENQEDLVRFLKYFKDNHSEHEKISNILIEKYIGINTRPPTAILSNLKINNSFNKFLQNNQNLDQSNNSYFIEEFQRLSKNAQESAENGDFLQAKQNINHALNFYSYNKNFIPEKKAWLAATLTGKALFYKGRDTEALDVLTLAKNIAPKEELSESTFYLLWPSIINKDLKGMKLIIDRYNLEKNFDRYDSKVQFWVAYYFNQAGENKKAISFYNKIINTSPYSFYSIISLKQLANLQKGQLNEKEILAKLVSNDAYTDISMKEVSLEVKNALKRYSVWNKIGNERFATLEIRHIQSLKKEQVFDDPNFNKTLSAQQHKEFVITNLIRLLNSQKKFIASFKIFQDSLDQNSLTLNYKIIKFIFPLHYIDIVKKNVTSFDPLIVLSLIRQESAFNPLAQSVVGAKGLMQLMPATAKRFNKRVKVKHLENPEINVAIGTKYLKNLINRYDGNLIFALASYNAGEFRVDKWRKDVFRSEDPLATIESIPFEESRNYVKLIYRNYFFYNLLQNKSILMTPLSESFRVTIK